MAIPREMMPTEDLDLKSFMDRMNTSIDNELNNHIRDISKSNGTISELVRDVEELQAAMVEVFARLEIIETHINNLWLSYNLLKHRVDAGEEAIEQNTHDITINAGKISDLQYDMTAAQNQITNNYDAIQTINGQIVEIVDAINSNNDAIIATNVRIDEYHPDPPPP